MKKGNKVLAGVLIFLLSFSIIPIRGTNISASSTEHYHAVCGNSCTCEEKHLEEKWSPLPGDTTTLTSGNYYLESNVVYSGSNELVIDGDVSICLNGYSISKYGKSNVVEVKSGSLVLSDCVGTGAVSVITNDKTSFSGGGALALSGSASLIVYNGTISCNALGSAIYCDTTGNLTIHNGSITGYNEAIDIHKVNDVTISSGTITSTDESGILCENGTFHNMTISGGVIEGKNCGIEFGKITCSGTVIIKGGTFYGKGPVPNTTTYAGDYYGVSFFNSAAGSCNLIISGGQFKGARGGFYNNNPLLNATISGGTFLNSTKKAGIDTTSGNFQINGGVIHGIRCEGATNVNMTNGDLLYAELMDKDSQAPTLRIYGGTVGRVGSKTNAYGISQAQWYPNATCLVEIFDGTIMGTEYAIRNICAFPVWISGGNLLGEIADIYLTSATTTHTDAYVSLDGYSGDNLSVELNATVDDGSFIAKNVSEGVQVSLVDSSYVAIYDTTNHAIQIDTDHSHSYISKITSPTCTEKGFTTYTCACGDNYASDYTEATGHKKMQVSLTNSTSYPFVLNDGVYTSTNKGSNSSSTFTMTAMKDCEIEIQYKTSTEANYDKLTIVHNSSTVVTASGTDALWKTTTINLKKGDKVYIKYSKDASVDKGDNAVYFKLDSHTVSAETFEPTCIDDVICDVCKEVVKSATGHKYHEEITTPTCGEQGYTTYTCENCDDSYTDHFTEPTNNHAYDNDCDTNCNVCGGNRVIQHKYNAIVTEPTCTEKGYTTHTCTVCGDIYSDNEITSLGHSYINVVKEATCVDKGYTTHTCETCGDTYTDDYTEATGIHEFENGRCIECNGFLESEHDYTNLFDQTWSVYRDGATSVILTFSATTYVEEGWDFIYIYGANDQEIGRYTGAELASKSVVVSGDTAKIRLKTDRMGTAYGFELTNISFEEEVLSEQLVGYTISLKGDIAVNVYMQLSEAISSDESTFIKFTFADGAFTSVPLAKAKHEGDNYIFTCNVQAPNMNDEFTVQLITSICETKVYNYSVKRYADYILMHTAENAEYAKAAPMVRAMLNYGGYSQLQFGHNTDALANEGLYSADDDPVLTENIVLDSRYSFWAPNTDIGLKYYGSSLLLNAKTTIRHYFAITGNENIAQIRENYTFLLEDGTILSPAIKDGMLYIDIIGINAAELDDMFMLAVKNLKTEATISVAYSALSYAKYVLDNSPVGTPLVNVIKAMCLYNEAANHYFVTNSQNTIKYNVSYISYDSFDDDNEEDNRIEELCFEDNTACVSWTSWWGGTPGIYGTDSISYKGKTYYGGDGGGEPYHCTITENEIIIRDYETNEVLFTLAIQASGELRVASSNVADYRIGSIFELEE